MDPAASTVVDITTEVALTPPQRWNRGVGDLSLATTLVRSIAVGHRWLQEIVDGSVANADDTAARESCSRRHVMMMISLSFLAPDLVAAAMHGRPPHGIGVTHLIDAPISATLRSRDEADLLINRPNW